MKDVSFDVGPEEAEDDLPSALRRRPIASEPVQDLEGIDPGNRVVITDIRIPFRRAVAIMVKFALVAMHGAVPALWQWQL